jgi:hypothetical protein
MMSYYKPILMSNKKPTKLEEKIRIKEEGVYYTLFLYENTGGATADAAGKTDHIIWSISPHILINGSITYHNTHGFLNGEQQPYLLYCPLVTILYALFLIYWLYEMNRFKDHLINLHYYILAIISISLL